MSDLHYNLNEYEYNDDGDDNEDIFFSKSPSL